MSSESDITDQQIEDLKKFLTESYNLVLKDKAVNLSRIIYLSMVVVEKYGNYIVKNGLPKLRSDQKLKLCTSFLKTVAIYLNSVGSISTEDSESYLGNIDNLETIVPVIEAIIEVSGTGSLINQKIREQLEGKCCFRIPCMGKKT